MQSILRRIYGIEEGIEAFVKISPLFETFEIKAEPDQDRFSQEDIILITYGDSLKRDGEKPLITLQNFAAENLREAISAIHILPFFPYSSDDGFSVKDFMAVDPDLGSWDDIKALSKDFKLMFDYVLNHISAQSEWFAKFLAEEPGFEKLAIETDPALDLSFVTRPRSLPLLTEFNKDSGQSTHVWTTFSEDQIDLNYANLDVLKLMVEVLLFYVQQGASLLRMDAVAYLWKEIGTNCIHQPQTHDMVKLFRKILDLLAPEVSIITETNVPHQENVSYFGDGSDEAQMVYNFALPPLVLHAFQNGSSAHLTKWASGLEKVSDEATYFNFLDSHDGVGVSPVKNILTKDEIEMMALRVLEHGGFISYKDNGDGTLSPYELNITWYSAINREDSDESEALQIKRFIAARSIAMVIMGVPGVYLPSLFGSKNDADAVIEKGETRSINRKTYRKESLFARLDDKDGSAYKVSRGIGKIIRARIGEKAFHPNAAQQVLHISEEVFALIRTSVDKKERILAITNIVDKVQELSIEAKEIGGQTEFTCRDILSGKDFVSTGGELSLTLAPYEVLWLKYS